MMLRAENVFKVYPGQTQTVTAVAGVTLSVSAGEFLAVCGRSGSGKSTLLALLAGLTEPTSGVITFDGTDLFAVTYDERTRLRRKNVGVVFQYSGLLPTLRAIDNVALPALIAGLAEEVDPYERANELLGQVGLADRVEAYPHELSGGEQRRVALARALINRPPLLLCDEPTADLDLQTASEVLDQLLQLHRHSGTTLIVATHDENLARRADRILYLEHGSITNETALLFVPEPPSMPAQATSPLNVTRSSAIPYIPATRVGTEFGKLLARSAVVLALGVCTVAAADWGAAVYRQHMHDRRLQSRRDLEEAALQQLRADIDRVTMDADGSYSLDIYLQVLNASAPVFVTAPAIRVFIQVDRDWVEVQSHSMDEQTDGVLGVSGKHVFRFNFTPKASQYTELLPGYMHIRFSNAMLISRDRNGIAGLFDRVDDYYIFLKPHDVDDAEICRKNKWVSAPLWIGMPPH